MVFDDWQDNWLLIWCGQILSWHTAKLKENVTKKGFGPWQLLLMVNPYSELQTGQMHFSKCFHHGGADDTPSFN